MTAPQRAARQVGVGAIANGRGRTRQRRTRLLSVVFLIATSMTSVLPLSRAAAAAPENDLFAQRADLQLGAEVAGTTKGSTREPGEVSCHSSTGGTVWYQFHHDGAGVIRLEYFGWYASYAGLYSGTDMTSLQRHGCISVWSPTDFRLAAGTYYVQVAATHATSSSEGAFKLKASRLLPPDNDDPATAPLLQPGDSVTVELAAADADEPQPSCLPNKPTAWHRVVAPATDEVAVLDVTGGVTSAIAVFDRGAHELEEVDCTAGHAPSSSRLSLTPGQEYLVAVTLSWSSTSGTEYTISYKVEPKPAHDDRGGAAPAEAAAPGLPMTVRGSTAGASIEAHERRTACPSTEQTWWAGTSTERSWWASFTSPVSGTGSITVKRVAEPADDALPYYELPMLGLFERGETTPSACQRYANGAMRVPLDAGVVYDVAVIGRTPYDGIDFELEVTDFASAPPNEGIEGRQDLGELSPDLAPLLAAGDNTGSRPLAGRPPTGCGSTGGAAWYGFVAAGSGSASVTVTPVGPGAIDGLRSPWWPEFDVAVYRIEPDGAASEVGCGRGDGGTTRSAVSVASGARYAVAVTGHALDDVGRFTLQVAHVVSPPNDHFAAARELQLPGPVTEKATTEGATAETGEPEALCGSDGAETRGTIWYKFVAPADGSVRIRLDDSDLSAGVRQPGVDLGASVRLNDPDSISLQAWGEVGDEGIWARAHVNGRAQSRFGVFTGTHVGGLEAACSAMNAYGESVAVTRGTRYYLSVATEQPGPVETRVLFLPRPSHDAFAHAAPVGLEPQMETGGFAASVVGDTAGATVEPGEPDYCAPGARGSLWYSVKAPADGVISVSTTGDVAAELLRGATIDSLEEVCEYRQSGDLRRPLHRPGLALLTAATRHETYFVRVTYDVEELRTDGPFTMDVAFGPAPANDDHSGAVSLGSYPVVQGSTAYATSADDEDDLFCGASADAEVSLTSSCHSHASVWYRYEPVSDGTLIATVTGGHQLRLLSEGADGTLAQPPGAAVATTAGAPENVLVAKVDGGRRYLIPVFANSPLSRGPFDLKVTSTAFVDGPTLSVTDAEVLEPDEGETTTARFELRLDRAAIEPVIATYRSVPGTADEGDFESVSGTAAFAPGQRTVIVEVPVHGDDVDEDDQDFSLVVSEVLGGNIEGLGSAVIIDDDEPPVVSVADATIFEGDRGRQLLAFEVSLDGQTEKRTAVTASSADGTATGGQKAPADYVSGSVVVQFRPGESKKLVVVEVLGDRVVESDEQFWLALSQPTELRLGRSAAVGEIKNDDPVLRARR